MMKKLLGLIAALLVIPGIVSAGFPAETTPSGTAIVFALITDTHIGGASTAVEDLQRTVNDINANPMIDFVVINGDVTEFGSDEEILLAHSLISQLNKPWYCLPGNHDSKWSESGCNTFDQVFGASNFMFEKGGYLFAGCASGPNMRMGPGQVPRGDLNWLANIMEKADKTTPMVFFNHYPIDHELANWDELIGMLKTGNPQMILAGHYHTNRADDAEGLPNIICRSNLRHTDPVGGYNIVTLVDGTATFAEKNPGQPLRPAWHTMELKNYDASTDPGNYPRPDYSVNGSYPSVKVVWEIQDSEDVGAGVATDGKALVYANTAGEIKAVALSDGKQLWSYKTGGNVYSTPYIDQGRVVIASTDSLIYCFDISNGHKIWTYKMERSSVGCPAIADGKVYVGGSDGNFVALALSDGKLIWKYEGINGFIEARPLVDDKVYIGSWGSELYALDKDTGKLVWKWNNGKGRGLSPAACWPVKANGKVFVATPERFATALDAETGRVIWHSGVPGNREAIGISADGSQIYLKNMNDVVAAVSTLSEELKVDWQLNVGYGYEIAPSPITCTGQLVFFPTGKGCIYAVTADGSSIAWIRKVSNTVVNHVLPIGDNLVATSTMDGKIALLSY